MIAWNAMVMILLAASAVFATGQQVYLDNGNGDPNVWGNPSDAANWNSPTATSDGALWLQTGGGGRSNIPIALGTLIWNCGSTQPTAPAGSWVARGHLVDKRAIGPIR